MNEPVGEFSVGAVRGKRTRGTSALARDDQSFPPRQPGSPSATEPPLEPSSRISFDWRRIASALQARRGVIGFAAGILGLLAFGGGYLAGNFSVRVTLLSRESASPPAPGADAESYRPRQFSTATLVNLMQSPELLRRVAAASQPTASESSLQGRMRVEALPGTELVALTIKGKHARSLVALANLFGTEAVALGRELQATEAAQLNQFCTEQLATLDKQLAQLNAELVGFQKRENIADPDAEKQGYLNQLSTVTARADNARIEGELVGLQITSLQQEISHQNPIALQLEAARTKLTEMLGRYTEAHPLVQSQRSLIADLERQLTNHEAITPYNPRYSGNPQVAAMYSHLVDLLARKATLSREATELVSLRDSLHGNITGLAGKSLQYATLKAQLDGLQKTRDQLAARQRAAQLDQTSAEGYYRVFAPVTEAQVNYAPRWYQALLAGMVGLILGVLGAGLVVAGRELADRRLKTAADVERETGLPVLASVGDLSRMTQAEQEAWAFRTWTALAGQLNGSPNRGLVCGFISSQEGEGRSTWIELLLGAAKQRGLQVMTVSAHPNESDASTADLPPNVVPGDFSRSSTRPPAHQSADTANQPELTIAPATAEPLARRPVAMAHIPLPGRVWNLAHRQAWQNSLAQLRRMDNLALLVELPPAAMPEAVLLAESLPQVIWLADSGKARVRETRQQLQTLRHAKCRLVGAVLNHEPRPVFEL